MTSPTWPRRLGLLAALACGAVFAPAARAAMIIEPVFNRVPGSGPADNNFPIYDPEFLINGIAYFTAQHPGEVITYASGDPRDPFLDDFHTWNNTAYTITGFTLRIIGTATVTDDPGTVVRGPTDAVWGDVNGDGFIGSSDIFSQILVSADGKEIRFEGGLLPVGGRFTDIHLAFSPNPPEFAGVLATPTPVPPTAAALVAGLAALALRARGGRRVGG